MSAMSKEHWIDCIRDHVQATGKTTLTDTDEVALKGMTRRQLFVVENLLAMVRDESKRGNR